MEPGRTTVYGNVNLTDHAQAHLGDIHNHYHQHDPRKIEEFRKSVLLKSLIFEGMGNRVRNVAAALPETCQWILENETFRKWSDGCALKDCHNLLWIKGKPGSGKSTIMKEILEWAKSKWSTSLNLSFFFNARAYSDLEKNGLGLYRSLVAQLLSLHSSLQPLFFDTFLPGFSTEEALTWTSVELQNFLLTSIRGGTVTELNIFIDALDEGFEDDVRSMLLYFEDLADVADSHGTTFRLCLSSRHYPHISVQWGLELILEAQKEHTLDIERYIDKRLKSHARRNMEATKQRLLEKSSGIFLWVVLVIPILNNLLDRGRSLTTIHAKLESIPQELSDLFISILARNQDDFDECITLLQLVLYSIRPLHPVELYVALKSKHDQGELEDLMISERHMTNAEVFEAEYPDLISCYILDCSRGLVEENRDGTVQFIHETVRMTLLKNGVSFSGGGVDEDGAFSADCSHAAIAKICLDCLQCKPNMTIRFPAVRQHLFASYAARHWWQHASAIENNHSDSLYDIATELLTSSPEASSILVGYFNIDRQNLRRREENYQYDKMIWEARSGPPLSALYYAAHLGIPTLVDKLIAAGADANGGGARFISPLHAASFRGHVTVVRQLLDVGAIEAEMYTYSPDKALIHAATEGHSQIVEMLLTAYADRLASEPWPLEVARNALLAAKYANVMRKDNVHSITTMLDTATKTLLPDQEVVNIRIRTKHKWETLRIRRTATGREMRNLLAQTGLAREEDFLLESIAGRGVRRFLDHWTLIDRVILDGDAFEIVPPYDAGCKESCGHPELIRSLPTSFDMDHGYQDRGRVSPSRAVLFSNLIHKVTYVGWYRRQKRAFSRFVNAQFGK